MCRALVAQWIERSPAKAEVVGSNPAKRAISFVGDDGAINCFRRCAVWSLSANCGDRFVLWSGLLAVCGLEYESVVANGPIVVGQA